MSLISGPRGLEGMETTTARNLGKADLMLYLGVDRACTSVIILFQPIIIYLFIYELNLFKGQLISEWPFDVLNFPKRQRKCDENLP